MDKRRWIYIAVLTGLLLATGYFRGIRRTPVEEADDVQSMRGKDLVYTKHAKCRMDCRHITREEILEALADGKLNDLKSDPADKPCPTFALEDRTGDGQSIRVVFADCGDVVKVVTAIDLDTDHPCECE